MLLNDEIEQLFVSELTFGNISDVHVFINKIENENSDADNYITVRVDLNIGGEERSIPFSVDSPEMTKKIANFLISEVKNRVTPGVGTMDAKPNGKGV